MYPEHITTPSAAESSLLEFIVELSRYSAKTPETSDFTSVQERAVKASGDTPEN